MPILISTTWFGVSRTDLGDALDGIRSLDVDGIELGSTHEWRDDFTALVRDNDWGVVFAHNFFPPARDELIVNLASRDEAIRARSIDHAKHCLRFASDIGCRLYTVHPGFMSEPTGKREDRSDSPTAFDFAFESSRAQPDRAFSLMTDALCELSDEARRLGVGLAVETQGSLTAPGVSILETPDDFDRLFNAVPADVAINLNLAHTSFASRAHGFSLETFIDRFRARFVAVEISHNDGRRDLHAGLVADSFALEWARRLADLPLILEFRDVDHSTLEQSVGLIRSVVTAPSTTGTGLRA